MQRRALLASLLPALAGCSLGPSAPSTEPYPTSGPNVFASFDWHPDRSELIVEFVRGNRVTAENTGRLLARTPDADDAETVWVDSGDAADPAATYPLAPGATLTHELPDPATTRLVWVAPDHAASRAVGVWRPDADAPGADE